MVKSNDSIQINGLTMTGQEHRGRSGREFKKQAQHDQADQMRKEMNSWENNSLMAAEDQFGLYCPLIQQNTLKVSLPFPQADF